MRSVSSGSGGGAIKAFMLALATPVCGNAYIKCKLPVAPGGKPAATGGRLYVYFVSATAAAAATATINALLAIAAAATVSIAAVLPPSAPRHILFAERWASGLRQLWTTNGASKNANKSGMARMVQAWPKVEHAWPKLKYDWPKCMGCQNSDAAKIHNDFGHA